MPRELTRTSRSQPPTVTCSSSHDHPSPDSICNLKQDVQKALAEIENYEDVTKYDEHTPMFRFAAKALENAVVSYRKFVAKAEPDDIAIDAPNKVQRSILRWYDEYVKKNEASRASVLKKPDVLGSSVNTNGDVMNSIEGGKLTSTLLSVETDDKREGDVAARSGRGDIRQGGEGSTTVSGEITGSVVVDIAQTPRRSSRKRKLSERAEADAVEAADGETEKPDGDSGSEEGDEEVDELDASNEEEDEDEDADVGVAKVETGKEMRGEVAKKATKKGASAPRKPGATSNAHSKSRGSRSSSARKTSARTTATTGTRARTAQPHRSAGVGAPNAPRSLSPAPRSKKVRVEVVLPGGKSAFASPSGRKTKKLRIDRTEEEKGARESGDREYKARTRSPQKSPATARKMPSRAKSTSTSITAAKADTSEAGVPKIDIPSDLYTGVPVPRIPNPKPAPAATLQENIHNVRLAQDALLGVYNFTSRLRLQGGSKPSKPKPESGAYWQADATRKLYDSLKLVGTVIASMEMMEVNANNEGLKGSQ